MQSLRGLGAAIGAICTVVASLAVPTRAGRVTPPDADPFYRPPAHYASRADGSVLKVRTVVASTLGIPLAAHATQLLFKSVNSHRAPTADVTTVLVPNTPWSGAGPRPIVSYQTAEDGVGTRCAPSYALRAGLAAATSNAALETPIIALLLARGWAVVTTDYEGPHSQFLAGPQEGYAVLDGIRAALATHPNGLSRQAPVALWGYSGGAFATAWAARLRAEHAPHLRLAGIAMGGLPADLDAAMRNIDGGYGFGLVFGGLIGLNRAYPEAQLAALLNDRGRAALHNSASACTVELLLEYALQRLSNYTVSAHPYATKRLHTALVHNSPGPARTSAPVYSYHAKGDELVPVRVADNFVARACKFGDRVQIVRPAGGSHNTELLTGAPGAINFLAQRFAGAAVVTDCP